MFVEVWYIMTFVPTDNFFLQIRSKQNHVWNVLYQAHTLAPFQPFQENQYGRTLGTTMVKYVSSWFLCFVSYKI